MTITRKVNKPPLGVLTKALASPWCTRAAILSLERATTTSFKDVFAVTRKARRETPEIEALRSISFWEKGLVAPAVKKDKRSRPVQPSKNGTANTRLLVA